MLIVRRAAGLCLVASLALAVASPLDAMRCATRQACPMMAKGRGACHMPAPTASRELSAPLSCCRSEAVAVSSAPVSALAGATTLAPQVSPTAEPAAESSAPVGFRANRHELGLFTLHAVWRI